MNKEQIEKLRENFLVKKEALIKCKDTFKVNIDKLFLDFKNESMTQTIFQLKAKTESKFNDYIENPSTKLKESNHSLSTSLNKLNEEITKAQNEVYESYKLKYDNLIKKINIESAKVKDNYENNIKIKELNLDNKIEKDNDIKIEEILKTSTLSSAGLFSLFGIYLAITEAISAAEVITFATYATSVFGTIGALAGVCIGGAGYGCYKIYKYFNKEQDLVKVVKESKAQFNNKFDEFCSTLEKNLGDDKNNIIDKMNIAIEKQILKMENSIKEIENNQDILNL